MKNFVYTIAGDFRAASRALQAKGTVVKAGGTDLLDLLKERIVEPDEAVSLKEAKRDGPAGEISALTTLAELAADRGIARDFPALHHAAAVAATPQVRNFATMGGNLCQHTRCWYFRNKDFACFKRGTGACAAKAAGALNRYHALFPSRQCGCAHPSNLAPALMALDAQVACVHPDGDRTLDVALLYDEPKEGQLNNMTLRSGELIRGVTLKASPLTRRSTYVEFRERESFDFAVVSAAVALDLADGVVRDVRIVLGAVAPTPYRAKAAEDALRGKPLDAKKAAELAVLGAKPLEQSAYKVTVARTLVRRALEELTR